MLLASATEAPPAGDHAAFSPVGGGKAVCNVPEIPSHEERGGHSSPEFQEEPEKLEIRSPRTLSMGGLRNGGSPQQQSSVTMWNRRATTTEAEAITANLL